ncbi:MAG: DoxX family protein [Acidobacteriota bacterium]
MINKFEKWAVTPLRGMVGFGFVMHGYAKLANGPDHFIGNLQALGVPVPELMGWTTIIIELLGGIALMIGAFVPLVSLPLAAILLVAAFTVHLQFGFSSIKLKEVTPGGIQFGQPGVELDLLYLAALAAIVLCGPGPFSIDGYRSASKKDDGDSTGYPER